MMMSVYSAEIKTLISKTQKWPLNTNIKRMEWLAHIIHFKEMA